MGGDLNASFLNNCTRKKTEIRIHEILSNGQHFNLYFKRIKNLDEDIFQWHVGLCISESRKEANLWYGKREKKKVIKSTGDCGLEGLRKALDYILKLVPCLGPNEELIIGWEDDRRRKAYQYLKRYGFEKYYTFGDHGKEMTSLGIRNPEFWEYEENYEGGNDDV